MSLGAGLGRLAKMLTQYKSLTAGLAILTFFLALSLYAVVAYPYDQVVRAWNDIKYWEDYPRLAKPAWIKIFTGVNELEGTIILDSRVQRFVEVRNRIMYGNEVRGVYIRLEKSFNYDYDAFPSQIASWIFVKSTQPVYVTVEWVKPEGTRVRVFEAFLSCVEYYMDLSLENIRFVQEYNTSIAKRFGKEPSYRMNGIAVLMAREDESILSEKTIKPSKGVYKVILRAESTDANADVDIKVNIYGTLYGLAGTDHRRRDLFVAIVWGAPVALGFGLIAAMVVTLIQMLIAAISAWYGGAVDSVIQRVNEVFMIVPFLPTIIMISLFYRFTLWTLLAVIVALGVWGGGLKTFRAMFLQIKEMPYIEAALAYGASSTRIVVRYMIPKVLPMVVPSIVVSVPNYVFLEAVLALMGISDPRIITWGRVLEEAFDGGALYKGYYHWILAPASMLVLISIAFALIGFTLDRVLNPRLKEM